MSMFWFPAKVLRILPLAFGQALLLSAAVSAQDRDPSVRRLLTLAPKLSPAIAESAVRAAQCARKKLQQPFPQKLVIIDYSLPSTKKRFWMFDLEHSRIVAEELVAHGKNSGLNYAERFSNDPGSLTSSLGLFRIGSPYWGKHGASLSLIGLERGVNDRAEERAIVLHGADYVSEDFIQLHRRLGRSWGCPALSPEATTRAIDFLSDGVSFLFAYYPDRQWLRTSPLQDNC